MDARCHCSITSATAVHVTGKLWARLYLPSWTELDCPSFVYLSAAVAAPILFTLSTLQIPNPSPFDPFFDVQSFKVIRSGLIASQAQYKIWTRRQHEGPKKYNYQIVNVVDQIWRSTKIAQNFGPFLCRTFGETEVVHGQRGQADIF